MSRRPAWMGATPISIWSGWSATAWPLFGFGRWGVAVVRVDASPKAKTEEPTDG